MASNKQTVKRKIAMAWLRADDDQGRPSIHAIKYRRADGQIGQKKRVSKSFRHLPGAGSFRSNLKTNHTFLFTDHDADDRPFQLSIDLLIEVDGFVIDHTNGDFNNQKYDGITNRG